MPDYPPAIYKLAADALERDSPAAEAMARAVLDSVAEQLGQHAAEKILAGLALYAKPEDLPSRSAARGRIMALRRHYQAAANIASFAFLTGDDIKVIAARELEAGNFVACPAPEDE